MNRRTFSLRALWATAVAPLYAATAAMRQHDEMSVVTQPPPARTWFSADRGDHGDVFDGDGIHQDYIVIVDTSDGYAVRFKRRNGELVVNKPGAFIEREEVMLKMPVRFVPRSAATQERSDG